MNTPLYTYRAICVKIISGDTFDAMIDLGFNTWIKSRIRLNGIQVPDPRSKDPDERELGLKSMKRLSDLILDEDFIVESKQFGKYGRSLAEIYCLGHNINTQMIEEGFAIKYSSN